MTNKTKQDRPALFGQESLPVLTVCSAARHCAQEVRVNLNDLVHIIGCCRNATSLEKGKIYLAR